MKNGRTLGFSGDEHVKYADVASGGYGRTKMVRIYGGPEAVIEMLFLIFKNQYSNYLIRGVPDDVRRVHYQTGPKGWVDRRVMNLWLRERRAFAPLANGRQRALSMDNCGHAITSQPEKAL